MVQIHKKDEPQVLIDYKQSGTPSFDDFREKDIIRNLLIEEQYGLCAYCMSRISNKIDLNGAFKYVHCKIEHFKPKSKYPEEQLNYKNMLGCCNGNEGKPLKNQTCDSHKRNSELLFNPSDEDDYCKMDIKFYPDGTIHSGDVDFEKQLDDILNLNASHLVGARKAIIDGIFDVIQREENINNEFINNKINAFTAITNGNREEFYYVAVYYLKKFLVNT